MALEIYWTRRADVKFDKIINYLQEIWGDKATKDFVRKSYEVFETLSQYPEAGSL